MRHLSRTPVRIAAKCMRYFSALSICLFGLMLAGNLAFAACLTAEIEPNNTDTTATRYMLGYQRGRHT